VIVLTDEQTNAPYVLIIGLDTPNELSEADEQRFTDCYSHTHTPDVVESHPGFIRGTRYELIGPKGAQGTGPRWLVFYEINSEASAFAYCERLDGPLSGYPFYRAWTDLPKSIRWRSVWRRGAEGGQIGANGAPYLRLVGLRPVTSSAWQELGSFQEECTTKWIPWITSEFGFERGTRYDLHRSFEAEEDAPYVATVLEGYEQATIRLAEHPLTSAELTAIVGPSTSITWNLHYRRTGSYLRSALCFPGTSASFMGAPG
jgi:hypothetical protein